MATTNKLLLCLCCQCNITMCSLLRSSVGDFFISTEKDKLVELLLKLTLELGLFICFGNNTVG